ncbi:GNAT family N-acetyltransferase [Undibacterium jejuense]|uniref:GNAT family N-acetyltransferase n=1 Tax=Undibacterium jejuense TaxID=1344949 RepID=A0A923HCH3_9BURK|nr:GNAT family N-acetyltransferase [Undibacterium jejuense]MBC3861982.1 GNAT family N-acetyltransferase [Undibacterium jejuense]
MQAIITNRLALRLFNINDVKFVYELMNDPSWIKNIGNRGISDLEKARAWIVEGPLACQARFGFSFYVVTLRDTGIAIGCCGLIKRDVLEHADIGYAFLPAYWGNGYALEAALATVRHAEEDLGLDKLLAITSPDNISSNKLIKKMGFNLDDVVVLNLSGEKKLSNLYSYTFPRRTS